MSSIEGVVAVGLLANGLLAGVFFTFSCAVSPALARLGDRSFVEAFRAINSVILNRWFLATFFIAPVAAVGAAVWAVTGRHSNSWQLVAAAVCASTTFIVTVAANVRLNRALDAAPTNCSTQYRCARLDFEVPWNRWNAVRTLTSLGALACLSIS